MNFNVDDVPGNVLNVVDVVKNALDEASALVADMGEQYQLQEVFVG